MSRWFVARGHGSTDLVFNMDQVTHIEFSSENAVTEKAKIWLRTEKNFVLERENATRLETLINEELQS